MQNSKDYTDKDFFLNLDGESQFEGSLSRNHVCITDHAEEVMVVNEKRSGSESRLTELVLGLGTEIPLWKRDITLKWRFNQLFDHYSNSDQLKNHIRQLLLEAIAKWGDASPVTFEETNETWDFEVVMLPDDGSGTLASAFFPSPNQDLLSIYPLMFSYNHFEQVETLIHETGHMFGLRHYFANEQESSWRSEIFGTHHPLTIMNYGRNSTLTDTDKADLKKLYSGVWNGDITKIGSLGVKLYSPYSTEN